MRLAAAFLLLAATVARAAPPDGKAVYLENCATCHGEKGKADTELGAKYMAADYTSADFKKEFDSEAKIREAVEKGSKGTKMQAWKGVLSAEEIAAVTGYVWKLSRAK
jgi:cbb3-type cytochrome c oxidase subunit III